MPSSILNSDDGVISGTSGLKSSGGDDGALAIQSNGAEVAKFKTTELVINDGGANYDFRVEGDTNNNLLFVDASTDRVGIGTNTPSNLLHVFSSGGLSSALFESTATNGEATLTIRGKNSSGTVRSALFKYDNGDVIRLGTADAIAMRFETNDAERMRIASGGDITFASGTTIYFSNATSAAQVETGAVNGAFMSSNSTLEISSSSTAGRNIQEFYNPNGNVGKITTSGSSTAFTTSSDYRLKQNVAPMTGALATVAKLNPVNWTWKADGSVGQGFIAHELQAVIPDAVSGEKDAVKTVEIKDEDGNVIGTEERPVYQGVDTSFLVATLTAAIQELKAELDEAKARIAALEAVPGNE
jgi:hypothetical protein